MMCKNFLFSAQVMLFKVKVGILDKFSRPVTTESPCNCVGTRCAQAVEQTDFGHANELINELRQHSSAYGNGSQRMAHYFMEALVCFLGF